jgi:hypothetical protein
VSCDLNDDDDDDDDDNDILLFNVIQAIFLVYG